MPSSLDPGLVPTRLVYRFGWMHGFTFGLRSTAAQMSQRGPACVTKRGTKADGHRTGNPRKMIFFFGSFAFNANQGRPTK